MASEKIVSRAFSHFFRGQSFREKRLKETLSKKSESATRRDATRFRRFRKKIFFKLEISTRKVYIVGFLVLDLGDILYSPLIG
jgi:hypothetical protein